MLVLITMVKEQDDGVGKTDTPQTKVFKNTP